MTAEDWKRRAEDHCMAMPVNPSPAEVQTVLFDQIDWLAAELVKAERENRVLRGLVQTNPDWKCPHGYNVDHMGKCPLGFPGCACADDRIAVLCEESDRIIETLTRERDEARAQTNDAVMRALMVLADDGIISAGRAREIAGWTADQQRDFWRREYRTVIEQVERERAEARDDADAHARRELEARAQLAKLRETCVVFDGPPGPDGPRFIEVEVNGKSIRAGEWEQRPDGLWQLRLRALAETEGGDDLA